MKLFSNLNRAFNRMQEKLVAFYAANLCYKHLNKLSTSIKIVIKSKDFITIFIILLLSLKCLLRKLFFTTH